MILVQNECNRAFLSDVVVEVEIEKERTQSSLSGKVEIGHLLVFSAKIRNELAALDLIYLQFLGHILCFETVFFIFRLEERLVR